MIQAALIILRDHNGAFELTGWGVFLFLMLIVALGRD